MNPQITAILIGVKDLRGQSAFTERGSAARSTRTTRSSSRSSSATARRSSGCIRERRWRPTRASIQRAVALRE